MSSQSLNHTIRQFGRAKATAQAALASPANEQVAIKALAPDMLTQCGAFEGAHAGALVAENASAKEVREALQALEPL